MRDNLNAKTAYITHPICLSHDNGIAHPESAQRLIAIQQELQENGLWEQLQHYEAPIATQEHLLRAHDVDYLNYIQQHAPKSQSSTFSLDPDTRLSFHSLEAAQRAAGAVILATELVITQQVNSAFCAVRPPGHHAKFDQAMGFCIYNNIIVGITHALEHFQLKRVALLDFDVHHGNGSENILAQNQQVLFCSTFQHPFYPGEPFAQDNPLRVFTPLPAYSNSSTFRHVIEQDWLPALNAFKPEMIFISAGFDAHQDDFLAQINLSTEDYFWVTQQITDIAKLYCNKRIVSSLEGGYHTKALAESVTAHLNGLIEVS